MWAVNRGLYLSGRGDDPRAGANIYSKWKFFFDEYSKRNTYAAAWNCARHEIVRRVVTCTRVTRRGASAFITISAQWCLGLKRRPVVKYLGLVMSSDCRTLAGKVVGNAPQIH